MMAWLRGQVAKVIFGVLLLAFLAWIVIELGMQGRYESAAGSVAVVNGEKITTQEFSVLCSQEMENNWEAVRGSLTEAEERDLRKTVLNRMVDQTLAWQEAKRLNYAVTKADVEATIRATPVFFNESGQFDPMRYQAALNRLGIPARLFEFEQERAMSASRVEAVIRDSVRVTDLELWLEYLRWHRRFRVLLMKLPLAEAKSKIKVTADEVKAFWEQNRKEYEKPEKVHLRHIVVAVNPPDAGPEVVAQARAKMDSVIAELKKGADFADVARRKSDSQGDAPRGGLLGWYQKGQLIQEYDERVFKLRKGQSSEVFQTKFGFHLIKCEDHQREEKPTFSGIKDKIRDRIVTAQARQQLSTEAARAARYAKKEKDLLKAAQLVGRKAAQTEWFERGKTPPAGLSSKTAEALTRALAALEIGDVTDVIETDEGFFIAQLSDEKHKRVPEAGFLKERSEIEPALLARKQKTAYDAWVEYLRSKAKIKAYLDAS